MNFFSFVIMSDLSPYLDPMLLVKPPRILTLMWQSVATESSVHGAILEEALIKGEKILQRSPADFEHLLKKMWYDKEDDGRFRRRTHQLRLAQWIK